MFKSTVIGLTCFLLGLAGGMAAISNADGIRLEVSGGNCKHRFAEDSSWSYRDWGSYETNYDLTPECLQIGASWMPWSVGKLKYGVRLAYVDLGKIGGDITYPVDEPEYFRAKETRTPINSETARLHGQGGSRGLTLGIASEYPVGPFWIGPETGVAMLYSTWRTTFNHAQAVNEGCRQDWACADGWHATLYAGATLRYEWLFLSYRRYANVHASQSEKNPLFIGPTTGPVDSVLVGLSIPLK
jgi:hypothetical protein